MSADAAASTVGAPHRWWAVWVLRAVLLVVGMAAGSGIAEVFVRASRRQLPVQAVGYSHQLRAIGPVVVWGTPEREERACLQEHPERLRIFVFGDSIAYGVGVGNEQVFTHLLADRLNQLWPVPGFCVLNFAQPGFGIEQSMAIAEDVIPRLRPAQVYWELWEVTRHYALVRDGLAVRVDGFDLRHGGWPYPRGAGFVPGSANRWLFQHSRLWEYLALAYPAPTPIRPGINVMYEPLRGPLARMPRLLASVGATGEFVIGTPLDRPFAESAGPAGVTTGLSEFISSVVSGRGMGVLTLASALHDQDYIALRMDSCCHFNPRGHEALAEIFVREVLSRLSHYP